MIAIYKYKHDNRLFNDLWYSILNSWENGGNLVKMVDSGITELPEKYTITWDMPGFEKDQIDINTKGNSISVRAKSDTRNFQKTVELGEQIDSKKTSATYKNDILCIEVKKIKDEFSNKIKIE